MNEVTQVDLTDEQALCARWLPVARVFFRRHVGVGASEDLAQEATVALLEAVRAERMRDPTRIGGFFLGICRNVLRHSARDRVRQLRAYSRMHHDEQHEQEEPREPIDRARLWACLNALGGRAREVLLRTYVEEDSAAEIAAALALTDVNVRVLRHRSLATLARCLESREGSHR